MDANNRKEEELSEKKTSPYKVKSCKGTLYYSTALKSKAYNPLCLGVPRALPQVSQSVAQVDMDASEEDRDLAEFHYACAGYSLYLDRIKEDPSLMKKSELPVCVGLELLIAKEIVDKAPAAIPVSAHVHHKEDGHEVPQTQRHQPTQSSLNIFLNKFQRNADLVASGVNKNICRIGNYVKGSLSEFLFPYSGRSK